MKSHDNRFHISGDGHKTDMVDEVCEIQSFREPTAETASQKSQRHRDKSLVFVSVYATSRLMVHGSGNKGTLAAITLTCRSIW